MAAFAAVPAAAQTSRQDSDAPAQQSATEEATATDSDAQPLGVISVIGQPINSYLVGGSAAATKSATPIIKTPRIVSVITRKQIEDQGARTVMQALRYTSGAFTGTVGSANRYDNVHLRGFRADSVDNIYLNGLKTMSDPGSYSTIQIDPYFLRRIDVIKGPASVLYGRNMPGGLIVLTTKQPLFDPYHEIEIVGGTQNKRGIGLDLGGPLNQDETLAYRLVGRAEAMDSQIDHVREKHYALAPSLTFRPSDDTSLTVMAYLADQPYGGYHGSVPADGSINERDGMRISRHFFDGEPEVDKFHRIERLVGYQFAHVFNNVWAFKQNFRYLSSNVDYAQVYNVGWAGPEELARAYTAANEHLEGYVIDNHVRADFTTGSVLHTVLVGLDYQHRRNEAEWAFGTASNLNAFDPRYGSPGISLYGPPIEFTRRLEETGLYAQDQMSIDQLHVTIGGRQDWFSTEDGYSGTHQDRHKFTSQAGVLYLFDNGLAPYASYAESFLPNDYASTTGELLEPTEATQYEAGLKFQPPGSNDLFSIALFKIDRNNVARRITGTPRYEAAGAIRSRGVELNARSQVTDHLTLLANYTYTDIEFRRSAPDTQGNTPYQAPRNMASIWLEYAFPADIASGLSAGAGARYVGESWADDQNTVRVPSFTVLDASLRYALGKLSPDLNGLEVRLNINNLLDKTYVSSCAGTSFCYYGSERTVTAAISNKW
ncbi:MAG TPA: TonB-dependent siderophore receptor [Gammaproteobacteria bacterium]|nr:TonB-dependent siderophore receptor [Gammaproteobacteria bacterium]